MKLDGKVAIVTGGARGVGLASAKIMAENGANIVIADVCENMNTIPYDLSSEETMKNAVDEIKKNGNDAIGIKCDVRKSEEVKNMVERVIEKFGKIDVLVNNAGTGSMEPVSDMSEEAWDEVSDTIMKGTFLCCRYVVPHMISQKSGKIVSISSIGGLFGFGLSAHYCAAKHGVIGLTKALAMEVADHNINANVICPGTLWTNMMQGLVEYLGMDDSEAKDQFCERILMKDLSPTDVANAVLWLVSDKASRITGTVIKVDGGWTAQAP